MRPDISATEAVRHFSELLNNIKYRGDSYTIIRGRKPAAALVPVAEAGSPRYLSDLNPVITANRRDFEKIEGLRLEVRSTTEP